MAAETPAVAAERHPHPQAGGAAVAGRPSAAQQPLILLLLPPSTPQLHRLLLPWRPALLRLLPLRLPLLPLVLLPLPPPPLPAQRRSLRTWGCRHRLETPPPSAVPAACRAFDLAAPPAGFSSPAGPPTCTGDSTRLGLVVVEHVLAAAYRLHNQPPSNHARGAETNRMTCHIIPALYKLNAQR